MVISNKQGATPTAPTVMVFDSGVGGLSILETLRQMHPNRHYLYASDNQGFPYGTKSEGELVARVDAVLKKLTEHDHPDIIVVACNTASTVALPKIRSHFSNPVVGVVPAIKPAAQLSQTKIIGLLGTPGTVARDYTRQLIEDFASDCEVISVGSAELVEIAEQKLRGIAPTQDELQAILAPFAASRSLDTIVLACTHFPLLKQELIQAFPRTVQWVDSGEAIARRVDSLLQEHYQEGPQEPADTSSAPPAFQTLLTAQPLSSALLEGLENMGSTNLEIIEVS